MAAGSWAPPRRRLAVRLLEVTDLSCRFPSEAGPITVLEGVDLWVDPGEVLCVVGESGSGKTVTALTVMRLLELESGTITEGSIRFAGTDLLQLPGTAMRELRGREIAMIFQEPMMAFNPIQTIGTQLQQALLYHRQPGRGRDSEGWRRRALEMLSAVGIADPEFTLRRFPHHLSGGMRQRVMIAMALMGHPRLLIADEPTTALDVTIQAQVLDLLRDLIDRSQLAVLFITHDMGVAAEIADRIAVMYAGQIVEQASASQIFSKPHHPYTQGLLASVPRLDGRRRARLMTIPGSVPRPERYPAGCRFQPRCPLADAQCREMPPLRRLGATEVRCWHAERAAERAAFTTAGSGSP